MIAAFDIGVRNFAFAVKNKDEYIFLKNTSLNDDIKTKSDLNKLKKKDLINILLNLKIKQEEKMKKSTMIDLILTKKVKNKHKDLGLSMFEIMDEYKYIWEKCDTFLIERQMTVNLQALKLSHYLEAYLKIHYSIKKILNYNASTKTKKLGGINLKTKKDRKKWTIEYTSKILNGDNLKYFETLIKQDDIADAICMIESYNL